jgi:O-antigen ligase
VNRTPAAGPDLPPAAQPRLPAPAAFQALALAAFAGVVVAVAGTAAGTRAIYYLAILGAIAIGGLVALTRREPLRFAFLSLLAVLPMVEAPVPPGRLGMNVFDATLLAIAMVLVARRFAVRQPDRLPLFPSRSFAWAWLLLTVCAIVSRSPADSALALLAAVAVYTFFLCSLQELRRPDGFGRLAAIWAAATIVVSLGLFIDHFFHVNLSFRGGNLNQLTHLSGREVWRAGGFFQDPQKAGAFLASMIAFLAVLAARGRFPGWPMRLLLWCAVAAGIAALFTTIARGAIVACLAVTALSLFAFNRWHPAAKMLAAAAFATALLAAALVPADAWLDLLPADVAARFAHVEEEFRIRLMIWFDTWDMFASHPLTGVGPGAFQSYLLETRPGMSGYYGIGAAAGVPYVPEQPENGYLTVLYEGGLLGSAAALLVAGAALRRAARVLAGGPGVVQARTETIAALAGLATFCITFTTLFTAGDSRIAALLMFLLAVIWRHATPADAPAQPCMRA